MTRDFNIAIVLNDPGKYSETFVRRHVHHLFGGHTVVVSTKPGAVYPGRPSFALEPVRLGKEQAQSRSVTSIEFLRRSTWWWGATRDPLVSFFHTHDVRFVLAEFGPQGVATYRQTKAAGLPMYCYFRGYDASRKLGDAKYVADVRAMCESIDGIVAVSASLLRNLASAGISCAQSFIIPSGTDTMEFSPADKRPSTCLAVGRFIEKKAPHVTIRAFARACSDCPELVLDMVGDGPALPECYALAQQLGLTNQIRFHGAIDHAEVRQLMRTSAYFLQHSVTAQNGDMEGMPSAIQEAMACGCVVIATRHGGIPEHIGDNVTGVLVEEYDEERYAAEIVRLVRDVALSDAIARNARTYAVHHFDYRTLLSRLEAHIAQEISGRGLRK